MRHAVLCSCPRIVIWVIHFLSCLRIISLILMLKVSDRNYHHIQPRRIWRLIGETPWSNLFSAQPLRLQKIKVQSQAGEKNKGIPPNKSRQCWTSWEKCFQFCIKILKRETVRHQHLFDCINRWNKVCGKILSFQQGLIKVTFRCKM